VEVVVFARTILALACCLAACSTPPSPSLDCTADKDCGNNQVCKLGQCVSPFACENDDGCKVFVGQEDKLDKLVTDGDVACADKVLRCIAKVCTVAPLPDQTKAEGCDDQEPGTKDVCVAGKCDHPIANGFCKIDGKFYTPQSPENSSCRVCAPLMNDKGWTYTSGGAPCSPKEAAAGQDDRVSCNAYSCDGKGACLAKPREDVCDLGPGQACVEADAAQEGSGGCAVCKPGTKKDGWTLQEGASCASDQCHIGACNAKGTCDTTAVKPDWCALSLPVDGTTCFANQTTDAAGCRMCDTKQKQTELMPVAAGSLCLDDGKKCTENTCDGAGTCAATPKPEACGTPATCQKFICNDQLECAAEALPIDTSCSGADTVTCTVDACDGKGTCVVSKADDKLCDDGVACTADSCDAKADCQHTATDASCDDGNSCTIDSCDAQKGCVYASAAVTVACADDGLACTADHCDGQGVCSHADIASDSCLIGATCVAAGSKQSGGCQMCTPASAQTAWSNAIAGSACDDDGTACTQDLCNATGGCTHDSLKAGTCLIDGTCRTAGETAQGGCQVCDPITAAKAWKNVAQNTACDGDKYGCTIDACDGQGTCQHTPDDGKCGTTPACLTHLCKPGDALSDATSGCFNVDKCAWGHSCNASSGACLTSSPALAVTTDPAKWPTPSNPAVGRHVLDPKLGLQRTWLVFQSQPAADASSGAWQTTAGSGMRALVLDDQVAPVDKKSPPTVLTLPPAKLWGNSATVTQAYPTLVSEPSSGRVFAGWLEADVGAGGCLGSKSVGGLLRLARLDGSGAVTAEEAACGFDLSQGPLFLTGGLGLLSTGELIDPAKRGMVWLRPLGANLASSSFTQLLSVGSLGNLTTEAVGTSSGSFSKVHPVLVDRGPAASAPRYVGLAFTEKSGSQRELWAQPIGADGNSDAPKQAWLTGTTAGAPGQGDLNGVTAVCTLDATSDSAGTVGLVMVVRRGAKNQVLFGKFANGALVGSLTTVSEVNFDDASAPCQFGVVGARVVAQAAGSFGVLYTEAANDIGALVATKYWNGAKAVDTGVLAHAKDTAGFKGLATIADRGLAALPARADGSITLVIASKASLQPSIAVVTLKP
jgi:hypothetical protein